MLNDTQRRYRNKIVHLNVDLYIKDGDLREYAYVLRANGIPTSSRLKKLMRHDMQTEGYRKLKENLKARNKNV